jgi:hypothetical protein
MQTVLTALQQLRFSTALVELYGLGLQRSSAGVTEFSRWQTAAKDDMAATRIKRCFADDERLQRITLLDAEAAPLALLACIEAYIVDIRHKETASDWAVRFTDSRGATRLLLRRRNPLWSHYPAKQSPNPRHYLKHHTCIPETIAVVDAHFQVDCICLPFDAPPDGPLSVRITHFVDGVKPSVQVDETCFTVVGLDDEAGRRAAYLKELECATAHGCHIWIAPEYSATAAIVDAVALALAVDEESTLRLVVPGSFAHLTERGVYRNRATVLGGSGKPICHVDKYTELSLPPPGSQRENIEHQQCVSVIDTPMGLFAVLICKDFCDESSGITRAVWDAISPDWMLVVAMGDENSLRAHHRAATDHFAKLHGVRVLLANQETGNATQPFPGFVCTQAPNAKAVRIDVDAGGATLIVSSAVAVTR